MSKLIDSMVDAVNEGGSPREVLENSLVWSIGSSVKINKPTTGTDPNTGATFTVPEDTVVTVLGVGGGNSGADRHVQLPDGKQAIIPFHDLGEAGPEMTPKEMKKLMLSVKSTIKDVVGGLVGTKVKWIAGDKSTEAVISSDDPDNVRSAHVEIKGALKAAKLLRSFGGVKPVSVGPVQKKGAKSHQFSVSVAKADKE